MKIDARRIGLLAAVGEKRSSMSKKVMTTPLILRSTYASEGQPITYAKLSRAVEHAGAPQLDPLGGPELETVRVVELGRGAPRPGDEIEVLQPAADVVPIVGVDEEEVIAGPDDPTEPGEESH